MIIEAGPAYAPALAALHAQAFPDEPWSTESFSALLAQPGMVALVDERGGFLLLRLVLDEAEILTLGVTARREGIATGLLNAAITLLQERDIATLHLEVAAPNAAARALYEKSGFTQAGLRRRYYADGSDALTLVKKVGAF
ncbi:MAG TPA: GNAT family N-acetyltransferase [Acidocella sp.]|jgi:ribosomal-protein-alanine N-acetyltransferase|uniref:GNAT family N-acetyltransferase n=1 Tax=Acidocella sp. TaxID=50710 RepID=UPI002CA49671|nr:GNAT family N-acetyltransferase [Acidocella sp.]HVE22884.1 GNAT family N-acetyltransferase [Acidocella sp.]